MSAFAELGKAAYAAPHPYPQYQAVAPPQPEPPPQGWGQRIGQFANDNKYSLIGGTVGSIVGTPFVGGLIGGGIGAGIDYLSNAGDRNTHSTIGKHLNTLTMPFGGWAMGKYAPGALYDKMMGNGPKPAAPAPAPTPAPQPQSPFASLQGFGSHMLQQGMQEHRR